MATADFKALGAVVTRGVFARQLLLELGVPGSDKNMAALLTVMHGEACVARYNAFATTLRVMGSMPFNSAGVQHYRTLAIGLQATRTTLSSPKYDAIRAALKKGTSLQAVITAWGDSPWGTRREDLHWQYVWENMATVAKVAIGQ